MSQAPIFQRGAPIRGAQHDVLIDDVRAGLLALAGAILIGGAMPGWDMTTSVALGEASPGTAEQPSRYYFRAGTGPGRYWVKVIPTWDATTGAITKLAFWWSDDNNKTYDQMRDEDGNYVVTVTYDSDLNLTGWTWGKS